MHDGSGRIVVQSLTKQFGSVTAVQNLSFVVEPGSVTGFLGPNGAGKTTTLRTVLGLVAPTGGDALINGVHFNNLGDPGKVVGAVLEAQGFHPRRSARNHLRVYAAAIGVPDSRADAVLQLVGLGAAGGRKAGGFSLGMRQRLALATALLGDPQILILDEPSNGLDPEGIAWLRNFLRAFAGTGRTVLISSHLLAEVEQTVDQVIIISRGQTMYNGPLENLRRSQQARVLVRPSNPEALVAALRGAEIFNIESTQDGRMVIGGVDTKQIADIALQAGVSIYGIEEERVNLEQLYFSLTNGQFSPGMPPVGAPPVGGFGAPVGYQPPATGYQPPATGYQPPAGGYQQPAIGEPVAQLPPQQQFDPAQQPPFDPAQQQPQFDPAQQQWAQQPTGPAQPQPPQFDPNQQFPNQQFPAQQQFPPQFAPGQSFGWQPFGGQQPQQPQQPPADPYQQWAPQAPLDPTGQQGAGQPAQNQPPQNQPGQNQPGHGGPVEDSPPDQQAGEQPPQHDHQEPGPGGFGGNA